jgi:hypothetical protein
MKLLVFGLPITSAAFAQDARQILLVQERDAQVDRLMPRIAYEVAHPYVHTAFAVSSPPAPPALTAVERDAAIRKLVKDSASPLYVTVDNEACLDNGAVTTTAAKGK